MVIRDQATITQDHFDNATQVAYGILDDLASSLLYHRKEHTTQSVVPAALAIAKEEGLPLEVQLLCGIAAAFHDTGFVKEYNANEPKGARIAQSYMDESPTIYTPEHVEVVMAAIINTNMKEPPITIYQRVVRDADLAVIGDPNFLQWNDALRKEVIQHPESPMHNSARSDEAWANSQLDFLTNVHIWYTEGARRLYDAGKQQNIVAFKEKYGLK